MQLRSATVSGLVSIEELLREGSLPTAGVAEHLANFIVADDVENVIGCGGIEYHGDFALIRSIAVASHMRGSGIGNAIVSLLLAECTRRAVQAVALRTMTTDSYFARHGFSRVAVDDVPGPLLSSAQFTGVCPASAIVMLKRL
ncbi:arsenic resistance N-acetyltransferase ArsN2 [Burkholderia sp. IMCC1007]|uniref:arsenic resistance N-acetyltransferase ArsN2 n=1 Tax=Burkholderia sp. IMCC1007 TaxID=3004104 RepID=UPI0022B33F04|nr:arsenic resistance N-acetyltransferase ArsN2 [Burkholderia sp. IMCC1007]